MLHLLRTRAGSTAVAQRGKEVSPLLATSGGDTTTCGNARDPARHVREAPPRWPCKGESAPQQLDTRERVKAARRLSQKVTQTRKKGGTTRLSKECFVPSGSTQTYGLLQARRRTKPHASADAQAIQVCGEEGTLQAPQPLNCPPPSHVEARGVPAQQQPADFLVAVAFTSMVSGR